jgi:hypothetical protein
MNPAFIVASEMSSIFRDKFSDYLKSVNDYKDWKIEKIEATHSPFAIQLLLEQISVDGRVIFYLEYMYEDNEVVLYIFYNYRVDVLSCNNKEINNLDIEDMFKIASKSIKNLMKRTISNFTHMLMVENMDLTLVDDMY